MKSDPVGKLGEAKGGAIGLSHSLGSCRNLVRPFKQTQHGLSVAIWAHAHSKQFPAPVCGGHGHARGLGICW